MRASATARDKLLITMRHFDTHQRIAELPPSMDSTLSPLESCDLQINPLDISASPTYSCAMYSVLASVGCVESVSVTHLQCMARSRTTLSHYKSTIPLWYITTPACQGNKVYVSHIYVECENEISDKFDIFWPDLPPSVHHSWQKRFIFHITEWRGSISIKIRSGKKLIEAIRLLSLWMENMVE